VANLYHRLPAVCAFRAACLELLATEDALAVDAHLSIQPAYALASLLGEIGLTVRPTVLSAREGGNPGERHVGQHAVRRALRHRVGRPRHG
jgi:hypothetical protein